MRGFIGLCLLITGLSIGAYSHYPGAVEREASLVEFTEIVTGAIHIKPTLADQPRERSGSQSQPKDLGQIELQRLVTRSGRVSLSERGWFANKNLLAALATPSDAKPAPVRRAKTRTATRTSKPVTKHEVLPVSGWRTAVVPARTITPNQPRAAKASLAPKSYAERWKLAKALQRELKRVGCYWGKIDGIWGRGSKAAMADFIQSVNAALPTKDPDYIQLRLVSGQTGKVCGVVDRNIQIASRTPPAHRAAPLAKPRPAPLPGRMAIGVLDRSAQPPTLLAPPQRITRAGGAPGDDATDPRGQRLRISALPDAPHDPNYAPHPTGSPSADDREQFQPAQLRPAPRVKVRTQRKIRKASVRKKKRRYRRRYGRRSVQSLFVNPLGFH